MKVIVYKKDIDQFLADFKSISSYDEVGKKYYFIFEDHVRGGHWTLMYYDQEGRWTAHGKGELYSDIEETPLSGDQLKLFIYKNRKYINNVIRHLKVAVPS